MFDFANILFAGPCNRACPWCIGRALPEELSPSNLDLWPLRNLERFIDKVNEGEVPEVVFTGTTTDPHLYRHEAPLIEELRRRLQPRARLSIHTNGVLSLAKLSVFNLYDRATVSFPSFEPATYEKLMGSRRVPDLARILERAAIPVKVSAIVNEHNQAEVDAFLERCASIGVRRVVLRRLFGDHRPWPPFAELAPSRFHRGNPVMDFSGMEVTLWRFEASTCRSFNLFADGTIGESYLLSETGSKARAMRPAASVLRASSISVSSSRVRSRSLSTSR
jgi:MoaA/NifB/PqqE/SkfB family radical SAM enzyme